MAASKGDPLLNEIYRLQKERDKARAAGKHGKAALYGKALNQIALAKDTEMEARKATR